MFFIGIFGIQNKDEKIGVINNTECISCGSLTKLDVYKRYSYFHIFFIPVYKWKFEYYAIPYCCKRACILKEEAGQNIEKGLKSAIIPEDCIQVISSSNNHCPYCNINLPQDFKYCPHCGRAL
jgi:hypothetical protein